MPPKRVAAVMTVFNRKEDTLRCLKSLDEQVVDAVDLTVYLVDDASTDGTAAAVAEQFSSVRLIYGDGELYWNGGMRLAFSAALESGYDFYWWLNDDVQLDPDTLARLLAVSSELDHSWGPGVVVGSMRDPTDGHVTYGGVVRSSKLLHPFRFDIVQPTSTVLAAETMNGNCVLIQDEITQKLGNLSVEYRQKMGDFDYGFRAQRAGIGVWVAPGTYGTCSPHPLLDPTAVPLGEELRRMWSVKELPFRSWATFTRRWGGILWPVWFLSPYVRRGLRLVMERIGLKSPPVG